MNLLQIFQLLSIAMIAMGCSTSAQSESEYYLFVGTYTSGESEGIYVYRFNTADGSLNYVSEAAGVDNPSYLAVSPNQKYLYAVNEVGDEDKASVSSFSFNKEKGNLTFLNKQLSGGGAPCYVSVDGSGKMVFAGNYSGGSFSMLPVNDDGTLAEAGSVIQHEGSSVNKSRQESPHVHCTLVTPDNKYLIVTDLGTDKVLSYPIDTDRGVLSTDPVSLFQAEPGAGPRHITFHPNGKYAYLINELNGTIGTFSYANGELDAIQTISTLPEGYKGAVSGADIHVSPDGKFLYASNRQDLNSIAIFSIDQETGKLTFIDDQPSGGVHPRNFTIDPSGRYLLVANRDTDNIVVFKRNVDTGALSPTGTEIELSKPVCLKMIPINQ